jgi:leucyl/phenylalanyl-tRNA--protein transferase
MHLHHPNWGLKPSKYFPPAVTADENGLVLVGGELSTDWLIDAYQQGIFPWPHYAAHPMLWWSPNPRAILPLQHLHIPRRLKRRLRRGEFQFTCDQDFAGVINACATGIGREGGTWLFPEMIAAYTQLHRAGFAHSIEVWQDEQLVGGLYGVGIGGMFAAESMFRCVRDASKAALGVLGRHLTARQFRLLDIQQWTPHTARMGALEVTRNAYLARLAEALALPCSFGDELEVQFD